MVSRAGRFRLSLESFLKTLETLTKTGVHSNKNYSVRRVATLSDTIRYDIVDPTLFSGTSSTSGCGSGGRSPTSATAQRQAAKQPRSATRSSGDETWTSELSLNAAILPVRSVDSRMSLSSHLSGPSLSQRVLSLSGQPRFTSARILNKVRFFWKSTPPRIDKFLLVRSLRSASIQRRDDH